jgi:antitoxin (DNA-binding transcriptional repressor) of toxin-antitoxin stability system
MTHVGVAEFKARFSELLDLVQAGEVVAIDYGRGKRTVAFLQSAKAASRGNARRRLGVLKGKARFRTGPGFKMSEEDFS